MFFGYFNDAPDRAYDNPAEMARSESSRPNGIQAVAILTPNDSRADLSILFLKHGIHVICDKPIGTSSDQALAVLQTQRAAGRHFILTHNYRAYPMVREARARVQSGELGASETGSGRACNR